MIYSMKCYILIQNVHRKLYLCPQPMDIWLYPNASHYERIFVNNWLDAFSDSLNAIDAESQIHRCNSHILTAIIPMISKICKIQITVTCFDLHLIVQLGHQLKLPYGRSSIFQWYISMFYISATPKDGHITEAMTDSDAAAMVARLYI